MAHNLVYFDSSTNTIQKFSNAQLDDLAERVLRVMASGTYTGTITIGTTNSIGTFVDTALVGAAGSSDTTQVSNTYTLTQVSSATLGAASDPPMYVGLDTSTPNQTVLQENLATINQLADEILSRMVASTGGTNAYYLASSAPSDGATWVSRGSLLDTITNLSVTVTDYKLWHRTSSGASITNRDPVKLSSGSIQSFSDAEIQAVIKTIEERIVATGIGTYSIQAAAPGTGVWTSAGTIVDVRENINTSNFTGETSYTNENALSYDATFVGTPTFTNPNALSYTATFLNNAFIGTTTSTGQVGFSTTVGFAGFNSFVGGYVATYNKAYTSTYLGAATFSGVYTGGPFPFSPGTQPTPGNFLEFFGTRNYTGDYVGNTPFNGPNYSGSFAGPTFSGTYTAPATFFGPVTYTGTVFYTGTAIFYGPIQSFEGASYLGPQTFAGSPTAYDGAAYLGTANYLGTADYEGTRVAPTTTTISTRTLWRRIA
jgi:hypothetical protein